jgi:hypothetical protein
MLPKAKTNVKLHALTPHQHLIYKEIEKSEFNG